MFLSFYFLQRQMKTSMFRGFKKVHSRPFEEKKQESATCIKSETLLIVKYKEGNINEVLRHLTCH